MVPLSKLPPYSRGRIVNIMGGRGLVTRLMQMGFTPGSIVEVVRNDYGPILVRVRGVTVAIGRGMANKIFVEPLP